MSKRQHSPMKKIRRAFDQEALAGICKMPEVDFGKAFDMSTMVTPEDKWAPKDSNYYHFRDNGSDILAVAHLDTVMPADQREAHFVETAGGLVVHSGALDDRLGAYIILDLLPKLDVTCDWLLTVGEEDGCSTAEHFDPPKEYNWVIEFDRGGTDVVMYQYDDWFVTELVKDSGARVGEGIFTDICFLEHLGVKGFNWGVGYRDYHGPRSHAYLDDTLEMVGHFLRFHGENHDYQLEHTPIPDDPFWSWSRRSWDRWDTEPEVDVLDIDERIDEPFDPEVIEQ